MKNKIVLEDTSLCSIVRDEKMNPAGGIARFIKSHVPFVEEAIIVDTGSVDGTREILEESQAKYHNLKVFDKPFNGFADARNYSLEKAKTKYALVLDADELLTHKKPTNDFKIIRDTLNKHPSICYGMFDFKHISLKGGFLDFPSHKNRFFSLEKGYCFANKLYECLLAPYSDAFIDFDCKIKHFVISALIGELKAQNFYLPIKECGKFPIPSQTSGFKKWKQYNPQRDNFN